MNGIALQLWSLPKIILCLTKMVILSNALAFGRTKYGLCRHQYDGQFQRIIGSLWIHLHKIEMHALQQLIIHIGNGEPAQGNFEIQRIKKARKKVYESVRYWARPFVRGTVRYSVGGGQPSSKIFISTEKRDVYRCALWAIVWLTAEDAGRSN